MNKKQKQKLDESLNRALAPPKKNVAALKKLLDEHSSSKMLHIENETMGERAKREDEFLDNLLKQYEPEPKSQTYTEQQFFRLTLTKLKACRRNAEAISEPMKSEVIDILSRAINDIEEIKDQQGYGR